MTKKELAQFIKTLLEDPEEEVMSKSCREFSEFLTRKLNKILEEKPMNRELDDLLDMFLIDFTNAVLGASLGCSHDIECFISKHVLVIKSRLNECGFEIVKKPKGDKQ